MRILDVNIKTNPNGVSWARKNNQPVMVYPEGYHDIEWDDHFYYDDTDGAPNVVVLLKDDTIDITGLISQDTVNILTVEEAIAKSEANEKRRMKITDEAKVKYLDLKVRLGQTLTKDEEKALDPNAEEPGFSLDEIFADRIKKLS
jgi:hypothetical protein